MNLTEGYFYHNCGVLSKEDVHCRQKMREGFHNKRADKKCRDKPGNKKVIYDKAE
ncbi:hypothetical protein D083_3777 [Dickeya solani RNS 08.23.3.1.A]|nr:hypothetical protein D083_3777 [Dickeya solani RNS 08.23.3.1.A]